MENQLNIDNQNNWQVDQGSISQNIQTPPKTKINYWIITSIIFAILFLGTATLYLFNLQTKKGKENFQNQQVSESTEFFQPTSVPTLLPVEPSNQEFPILLDSKEKLASDLDLNLLNGNFVSIPETDLEVKIPLTYNLQKNTRDVFLGTIPVLSYRKEIPKLVQDVYECGQIGSSLELRPYINEEYCKPILAKYGTYSDKYSNYVMQGVNTFFVHVVTTSLTPQQWVAQNVSYEGEKWNKSMGTGRDIKINNLSFFSVNVACCGGYEQVYLYPYNSLDNQKIILLFATNNRYGSESTVEEVQLDRNIVLDRILSTLRKKQ